MYDIETFVSPGLSACVETIVDESRIPGGGTLGHLITTPAYVDLLVRAATDTVEGRLPEGLVTVGISMEFTHEAPTTLGMSVRIQATLKEIISDRMVFDIIACDDYGVIGYGKHVRAVVNQAELLEKANSRLQMASRSVFPTAQAAGF